MPESRSRAPGFLRSLSARLLLLTVFFVMLAEVLIYAPSIARFRLVYLQEKIASAHLASLALEATPDNMVSRELAQKLLHHAGARSITLRGEGASKLMLSEPDIPPVDATVDLDRRNFVSLIVAAFETLLRHDDRILRVMGRSPKMPNVEVGVVIDERPLRLAMIDYSGRILGLSIIISLFTAALVYLSLQLLMVFPMRRITESMTAFRKAPEDQSRTIVPGARSDEIGVAQRELHDMQTTLRTALRQKARLAAVGTAVTKISHDLRAILASASLVSDRLAHVDDPEVKRLASRVMDSIDRAVNLCSTTLRYAREDIPPLHPTRFPLGDMIEEVCAALPVPSEGKPVRIENRVPQDLQAVADRDQLFRVLTNLAANATQAGANRVRVSARRENGNLYIDVSDDGPGLPEKTRETLFTPFSGSMRNGGTGLGLAIARELARAHGGDLVLTESGEKGTRFRLQLPLSEVRR